MAPGYPPFHGPRRPVAAAAAEGGGTVTGRVETTPEGIVLADASGRVRVELAPGEMARPGDWISGRLVRARRPTPSMRATRDADQPGPAPDASQQPNLAAHSGSLLPSLADDAADGRAFVPDARDEAPGLISSPGRTGDLDARRDAAAHAWRLVGVVVHAPSRGPSPDADLAARLPLLARRADLVAAARGFFRERGFLEVETPARVACPGLEPHLRAFPAGGGRWLITSPELHLKRLVAAGAEKVVELARAFRDDERGRWHRPEFLLLEWYRAFEGLEAIEADCETLVGALAAVPGVDAAASLPGCDLTPPFERTTVREAVRERAGLDLAELRDGDVFARAIERLGHAASPGDDWDDLFFRLWIAEVEPHLGRTKPIFVRDYPPSQAALARLRRTPEGEVAERFELYVAGVEIANAFHELNDPEEQRRRHRADQDARRRTGAPVPPLDEPFLAALQSGMPPCSGVALGLERLAALLLGARSLDEIVAFPE